MSLVAYTFTFRPKLPKRCKASSVPQCPNILDTMQQPVR